MRPKCNGKWYVTQCVHSSNLLFGLFHKVGIRFCWKGQEANKVELLRKKDWLILHHHRTEPLNNQDLANLSSINFLLKRPSPNLPGARRARRAEMPRNWTVADIFLAQAAPHSSTIYLLNSEWTPPNEKRRYNVYIGKEQNRILRSIFNYFCRTSLVSIAHDWYQKSNLLNLTAFNVTRLLVRFPNSLGTQEGRGTWLHAWGILYFIS